MAHFNHAFGKAFYAKALKAQFTGTTQNTSASLSTIGDFAFIDGKYDVLDIANVCFSNCWILSSTSCFSTK